MDRTWGLVVLVAALAPAVFAQAADEPQTGTLIIAASGFESEDGEVLIQLANSREDYESDKTGFRTAMVKASSGKAEHRFEDIPYGEYAIKLFHDENSNQELDIGWMGPEERYGFSNGARGTIGPPDWDDARFELEKPELTATIVAK